MKRVAGILFDVEGEPKPLREFISSRAIRRIAQVAVEESRRDRADITQAQEKS